MKTLQDRLNEFYKREGIPKGGINSKYFSIRFLSVNLQLPNLAYRKKVIHVHDLQHILNQCDTSWKGEAYIAGWELATGIWRHPILALVTLWTLGYCIWQFPKAVYGGYKKGLAMTGIIDLKMSKEDLLALDLETLKHKTTKKFQKKINLLQIIQFGLWVIAGVCVFLLPLGLLVGMTVALLGLVY